MTIYFDTTVDQKLFAHTGAGLYKQFFWYNNNVAVDLTSATAAMKVRSITYPTVDSPSITMGNAVISVTSPDAILLGTTNGSIEVLLQTATLASVAVGRYYYDLEITIAGEIFKPIKGEFVMLQGTNQ